MHRTKTLAVQIAWYQGNASYNVQYVAIHIKFNC